MSAITRVALPVLLLILWVTAVYARSQNPVKGPLVDLTHAFNAQTIYWPTSPSRFDLKRISHGQTHGGYFYASNSFCAPEHGGTHIDAPVHFAEGRKTVDEISLEHMVGPAVVIDVSRQAARDRDYRLMSKDVLAFEKEHGPIAPGTMVLLRTDWSRFWPDRKAYLGDDKHGDASKLRFPGYGVGAVRLLVQERGVRVIGVDTASVDYGRSKDFIVHQITGAMDVVTLENLTNLDKVPPHGATVVALPMKIEGGTGSPVRIIAILPR